MKATIFDIQRNSYVDGPGIRTTVFFKGCNLRCAWCHNPEGQSSEKQILFDREKCVGCGRCKNLTTNDTDFICFHDAKELCGRDVTVADVLDEITKDNVLYETSGGGVTFSGGECMLQLDFLEEILKKCKQNGIHTAVDTAGYVPFDRFERILRDTDLFLYDVKCFDREKHKHYAGVSNELILENLEKLLQTNAKIWVRIPIIEGVNDRVEEMRAIKTFFMRSRMPDKTELLPYHAMGEHKYQALGRPAPKFHVPSPQKMEELRAFFAE